VHFDESPIVQVQAELKRERSVELDFRFVDLVIQVSCHMILGQMDGLTIMLSVLLVPSVN